MSVGFAIVGAGDVAGVQVEATRPIPEARAEGRPILWRSAGSSTGSGSST